MFEEGSFCEFFSRLTGFQPYPYQVETARMLYEGHNVVLRAPTGAGKTLSVLAPFLFDRKTLGLSRLIYALPLRSLAHGIFAEAKSLAEKIGLPPRSVTDAGKPKGRCPEQGGGTGLDQRDSAR